MPSVGVYSDLANQRKAEELKLRYMRPDHIKEHMRGECLALWATMLADLNYPDEGLIKDMVQGFPPIGWMPCVQVDASTVHQHEVPVGHTVERKLERGQAFEYASKTGRFSTKLAERLRGRMVFYECFAAGRTTNLLLKKFGSWYRSQRFVEDLAPEECELILALKQRVSSAEPIGISPKFMETWFILTDGA